MKSPLTQFIVKALCFFIVWYVIYELWLLPDGSLDEWISLNIISNSAGIVDWLGYEVFTYNRVIGIYGSTVAGLFWFYSWLLNHHYLLHNYIFDVDDLGEF